METKKKIDINMLLNIVIDEPKEETPPPPTPPTPPNENVFDENFIEPCENNSLPLSDNTIKRENKIYNRSTVENWNSEISELETYFKSIEIPNNPLKINSYSTILDCSLFIESHFSTVKANNGRTTYKPYLNRLHELKQYFLNN